MSLTPILCEKFADHYTHSIFLSYILDLATHNIKNTASWKVSNLLMLSVTSKIVCIDSSKYTHTSYEIA